MVSMVVLLKIFIQLVSIYRAAAMLTFVLFYTVIPNEIISAILITAILSDLLDGYLAKKYQLTSLGGKLLDLFSDKYLNCISIIFLIIEGYPLLPLLMILTKEIFVLSFRSIEINGKFVISTNRTLGGIMTGILWFLVLFHVNKIFLPWIKSAIVILGILNVFYLLYKIASNISVLRSIFKSE